MTDHTHPLVPSGDAKRFISEITAAAKLSDAEKSKAFHEFVLAHVAKDHLELWRDQCLVASWDVGKQAIRWKITEHGLATAQEMKVDPPGGKSAVEVNAQADDILARYVANARRNPVTTDDMTDYLLDDFWEMACHKADNSDDPNPSNWEPTLLALVLATAIQRIAAFEETAS